MHRKPEFVGVLVLAALSISSLVFLVFFLATGPTGTPTGAVVGGGSADWFVTFLAGFIMLIIASTTVYHYWHHK